MAALFFLFTLVFHCLNIYHQFKFDNPNAPGIKVAMNFVNGFFSLKYFFPYQANEKDSPERIAAKKKANLYLYGFYIFFLLTIITAFIQMPLKP
jgi:hypothetical protein